MTGTVFNVQRYSVHDGSGIRTTAFLKGCPLACSWCHNPEGIEPSREILVLADRCVGCLACVEACPQPAVDRPDGKPWTNRAICRICGRCVAACARGARKLVGREVTVEGLAQELERDRPFYEESGGGVTLSGGEPLMQADFALAVLELCRERGLHTALDTSGAAPTDVVVRAAALSDLVLFDLKQLDPDEHRSAVGAELGPILENLRAMDDVGVETWIRFPLIPGATDSRENVTALADTVLSLTNTRRIHVLPFHRTAADKYARLERSWRHDGLADASEGKAARAVEYLLTRGLDARLGG